MNGDERHGDAPPADDPGDHPLVNPYYDVNRRPRATAPGAVAVVRRGLESSDQDGWDPTEQQESDDENDREEAPSTRRTYLDAAVTPGIMQNRHETWNKQMLVYASIAVLILGGTAAGIAIAVSGNMSDSSNEPPEYTEPPITRCDFTDMVQPNPILQCACNGSITVLTDDVRLHYIELKESFIPNLFPDELFDYPIESCEPQNAALLWLAVDADNQTPESMQNRYLLSLLYAYWRGLDWTDDEGWLTPASECTWSGITCSGTLVFSVDLYENNLQGSLVTELGLFQDVQTFLLGLNELGGSLPSEIAGATSLEVLKLENNNLVGSIPAEIVNLINLEAFDFSKNDLTGSLPTNIGLLSSLKVLSVSQNSLVGPIPETISLLTKLEEFEVQENQLTGTLPLSLFNFTTLDTLSVGFNNFITRPFPTTVGQLTNLETLHMPSIALNGTIPTEIGKLTKLSILILQANQLTGTIPAALGNLALAETMLLHLNQLQGSMPQEVCMLTEIGVLKHLVVSCGLSFGPDCDCCIDCLEL